MDPDQILLGGGMQSLTALVRNVLYRVLLLLQRHYRGTLHSEIVKCVKDTDVLILKWQIQRIKDNLVATEA